MPSLRGPASFQLQADDGRRPATLKTGTTNDFKDLQAYGYLAGNPDDPDDANGAIVTGVDIEPAMVHLEIPVFENLENRTVPVNPVVTGTPG